MRLCAESLEGACRGGSGQPDLSPGQGKCISVGSTSETSSAEQILLLRSSPPEAILPFEVLITFALGFLWFSLLMPGCPHSL